MQLRWLRENWHLIPAGKTLAPVAASFYELMTAPTTKVMMMMMINRKPLDLKAEFILKYDLSPPSRSWRNGLSRNR